MASKFENSGPKVLKATVVEATATHRKADVTKLSPAERVEAARAAQVPSEGVDHKGRPLNVITEDSFNDTATAPTKAEEKAELEKALAAQEPFPPVEENATEAAPRPERPVERVEVSTMA